jgi:hypothetical protein
MMMMMVLLGPSLIKQCIVCWRDSIQNNTTTTTTTIINNTNTKQDDGVVGELQQPALY